MSSALQSIHSSSSDLSWSAIAVKVRSARTTPLGRPVVPLVYICASGVSVSFDERIGIDEDVSRQRSYSAPRSMTVSGHADVGTLTALSTNRIRALLSRSISSNSRGVSLVLSGTATAPIMEQAYSRSKNAAVSRARYATRSPRDTDCVRSEVAARRARACRSPKVTRS